MNLDAGPRPNKKSGIRNLPPSGSRGVVWNWLPVAVYCLVIFIQSSFASLESLSTFKYSDKLLHLSAYGLLAVLVCRAANGHARWRYQWGRLFFIGMIATTLYGLSDEWHQSFVLGRHASVSDFIADFLGSVVGSGGYSGYFRWRHLD